MVGELKLSTLLENKVEARNTWWCQGRQMFTTIIDNRISSIGTTLWPANTSVITRTMADLFIILH